MPKKQQTEIRRTQVNLEGLLEVLGENLYSTPVVAVRELVQNAHDACVRRRVEDGWDGKAAIRVIPDPNQNTLTIVDNGSGLTRDEIVEYLATIGSGYTRVLRNKSHDENAVGYFGLGFLTSYVVADEVEFYTTSFREAEQGWRFASSGGQRYTIEPAEKQDVGSKVILHLKDIFYDLADIDFLEMILSKYCCLLPIEIYLGNDDEPVNRIDVPWRMDTDHYSELRLKKASLEFAELFDHSFEPIVTIPIPYNDEIKAHGLLWIQDGSYYASSDNRITTIFIRSMHITDECKELLPVWAGFVGCVIDCTSLTPTASRESVQQDEEFDRLKFYIKEILIDAIVKMAQERDANWRRIQSRHNQSLLGASISDPVLFEAMHADLTLPTSEGELNAREIAQRSGDQQLRISMEQAGGYEYLVSKSLGIPVIYGYRYAVMSFCRELRQVADYQLVTLGSSNSNALFPEEKVAGEEQAELEKWFDQQGTKVVVSRFEPASLPTVKVFDQDALLKKRIESDELDRHIGSAAMMMARQFTRTVEVEHESYLYLNYSNPLIKKFVTLKDDNKASLSATLLAITNLLANQSSEVSSNIEVMQSLSDNLLALAGGNA